ncbi:Mov34/MPN/PAD-1 family protein [Metapseudomonas furukawaii]|uniref:Mov34/MPN/PAD-1 family protein n=1 Tax=Metapseudomonas furukawaii TaxID=1149133 RepID=UPI0009DA9B5E|nr:Mov34/MPN/PAD-1 family protein [Pseudomonas furukawaii]
MLHLTNWASSDLQKLVYIHPAALELVLRYAQVGESDPESGGILLGNVRGPHLEILEATTPTRKDRRFRYLFERTPYLHQVIASLRWKRSGGEVRYLGEWHTHPEDYPRPSGTDIHEWRKLAKSRVDQRPLLAVIVGRKGLHVEYMFKDGRRVVLRSFPD